MTVTTDRPEQDLPMSQAIRAATTQAHGEAEQAPFTSALLAGDLPIEGYARLVAQHRAIYDALEAPHDAMRSDPIAAAFVDDRLRRLPALDADLEALLGPDWAARPEAALVPATTAYCARLREVGAGWPSGWVAHHYVRYLGDLSGGLRIRRVVEHAYGIDATSGTAFYDFPEIPDPGAWKDAYRRSLDAAPWDRAQRAAVTAEILEGYRFNIELLAQLGADEPFLTDDVVAAVVAHMNGDHAEDNVVICRVAGGHPEAVAAVMTGLDRHAIEMAVTGPDGTETIRIPFSEPISERAQIRAEVARLYHQSAAALGLPNRER